MSSHLSAVSIELDDDHILKAVLRNEDGDEEGSVLDLDSIIGNDDGISRLAEDFELFGLN